MLFFIQELLYNIIQYLSYSDFMNFKLTNKSIYNILSEYENITFKKYVKKLSNYDIEKIKIFDDVNFIKKTLEDINIPVDTFRVHDYNLIITDNMDPRIYSNFDNLSIDDFEYMIYINFTFYYRQKYHEIKFYIKNFFADGPCHCTSNNKYCNLYYNLIGFNNILYDEYESIYHCSGHDKGSFKYLEKEIPYIHYFIHECFSENINLSYKEINNNIKIQKLSKNIDLIEKKFINLIKR
jgi:hypothetical protein